MTYIYIYTYMTYTYTYIYVITYMYIFNKTVTAPGYLALARSLKGPATPRLCGLRRCANKQR